jgi:hypothetical protein
LFLTPGNYARPKIEMHLRRRDIIMIYSCFLEIVTRDIKKFYSVKKPARPDKSWQV